MRQRRGVFAWFDFHPTAMGSERLGELGSWGFIYILFVSGHPLHPG